jgi:hypothetical protein
MVCGIVDKITCCIILRYVVTEERLILRVGAIGKSSSRHYQQRKEKNSEKGGGFHNYLGFQS